MERIKLEDIAEINTGYQLRSKVVHDDSGQYTLIQMSNTSNKKLNLTNVLRANLQNVNENHIVRIGDVLFVSKGINNYATVINISLPNNTVAAYHFFRIRIYKKQLIASGYLAWYLNENQAQRYFYKVGEGTNTMMVTRKNLGKLPIPLPSLEKQKKIIELYQLLDKEKELTQNLYEKRKLLATAICQKIIEQGD
ncbi:restriction endonuclease subunit S [Candidatus Uabimicrobium amorphum]|uniref:Type I restriction modification DNA specificity domain-containing protein n=1 Tax=Uabimicrobium amorphum TaxID=2596890 RepID=A0A5S9IML6_UABAM|nr:restriction endonuclease subunit S [Candidatus Uabimicrobium amorphum]BBM83335.1 hypothetical protein UABAM_01687 [Candidatus Uabimicrobium amorphum]